MGELMLSAYLANLTGQEQAKATSGWGGDRFSLVESLSGERALAALIAWDTGQDVQEFYEVVAAHIDISDNMYVGINGDEVILVCRRSTIMSVVNRSGKMSVHERIDIDPERTGKAPSAQRYPGRSDISG